VGYGGEHTVIETDGVVTGVVCDTQVEYADAIVQTLENGFFLATEDARVRETIAPRLVEWAAARMT
jgi:hypothetical protein